MFPWRSVDQWGEVMQGVPIDSPGALIQMEMDVMLKMSTGE
jgi:hypothetical protein